MNIAVLAWGSLVWDRRVLKIEGDWCSPGPSFPLEFSRISRDGRLTLVIDPTNGIELPTCFAKSGYDDRNSAIENLRDREGTKREFIGWQSSEESSGSNDLAEWLSVSDFEAAIWTALPSNFETEIHEKFSVAKALDYLSGLDDIQKDNALEYFRRAPSQIRTPLRSAVEQMFPDR